MNIMWYPIYIQWLWYAFVEDLLYEWLLSNLVGMTVVQFGCLILHNSYEAVVYPGIVIPIIKIRPSWGQPIYLYSGIPYLDIDGLVQERCNSSALAMELRPFCTNPMIWWFRDIEVMTGHFIYWLDIFCGIFVWDVFCC